MATTTFIERMRTISDNEELVQRMILNEIEKNKAARKDQLFKELTFKYYKSIKLSIERASSHGNKYVYMNFNRTDFKANINGLGSPAIIQRKWLAEMCNPDSKYLIIGKWVSWVDNDRVPEKLDSLQGLNYAVWNNVNFTTVFSWDPAITKHTMNHYHTRNWETNDTSVDDTSIDNTTVDNTTVDDTTVDDTTVVDTTEAIQHRGQKHRIRCVWAREWPWNQDNK
jgi:hypothetical protein